MGNQQSAVGEGEDFGADAVGFVADDERPAGGPLRHVAVILSVERCRRYGEAFGLQAAQRFGEIGSCVDGEREDAARARPDRLGVEGVGGAASADDRLRAEPGGGSDDRADVARILHVVERHDERPGGCGAELA